MMKDAPQVTWMDTDNCKMNKEQALAVFEDFKIRRTYDEKSETWYFSVVDIIAALI